MENKKIFILLLVSFLAYSNTLFNSFIWDDKEMIVKNPEIKTIKNIPEFFVPKPKEPYRPMRKLLFSLNYFFFGLRPGFYHLTNVLLHLTNVLLMYYLILLIIKSENLAFFSGLIFGLNPAWNEAIVWIKNCSDLLCTIFFLLAFYFYIKKKFSFSGASFILSLFTKEIAFVFPLIISLYVLIFEEKKNIKKTIPFWLLGAFYFIFLWIIYKGAGVTKISPGAGMFLGFKILLRYFLILIFPFYLNAERNVSFSKYIFDWQVILGFFLLIFLIWIVLRSKKKIIKFSFFWIVLNLLPVLNPAIVAGRPLVEHRLYIPGIGFSILLAYFLQKKRIIFYFLIPLFFLFSSKRNFDWKNPLTFWSKTAKTSPHSTRAVGNLGIVYKEKGDFPQAEKFLKKAIELDPKNDNATTNLIEIYIKTKRYKEAKELIGKFLKIRPEIVKPQYQLAEIYKKEGKIEEAKKLLKRIIALYPEEVDAYNGLAILNHQDGETEKAVELLKKAIQINPNSSEIYNNLGTIYYSMRDYKKAIEYYKKAIKIDPSLPDGYYNLANTMDEIGETKEAIKYYKKAIKISPDFSDAWYNLGIVLMKEGKFREAARCFKKVMEIEPENLEVKRRYEEARSKI